MALFTYKAKDEDGKLFSDTIQASGKSNAVSTLKSQGVQVLTIKQVGGINDIFAGRVSVSEKSAFCRFMATMLRSGMGLPEAVEMIRQETKSKQMQKVLADVSYQTKKGKALSSVFENYKKDFDPVFMTMIRVGEESGTLEKSFDYLAKQLSASHELAEKIKGSLMYPAVIVVAMFGNGLLMMVFVLPRLSQAFSKLDVSLPFYPKILLSVGDFFEKQVEFSLKKLTSLIEPSLMLLIGVVVGVMVIMMIAPIYSIISVLQTTISQQ